MGRGRTKSLFVIRQSALAKREGRSGAYKAAKDLVALVQLVLAAHVRDGDLVGHLAEQAQRVSEPVGFEPIAHQLVFRLRVILGGQRLDILQVRRVLRVQVEVHDLGELSDN